MSLRGDPMHGWSEMPERKGDGIATKMSHEDRLQQKVNAGWQQRSTEIIEKNRRIHHPETAGKGTSTAGSACTLTNTTTGSDRHPKGNNTSIKDEKIQNRHVQGCFERLRKDRSRSSNWSSRMPPTPSSSSSSLIRQEDIQEHNTTSIRQRPRRMTKQGHLEKALHELLTESCTVPTFTSTSARQASHITAPEMVGTAAWASDPNIVMQEGKNQKRAFGHSGYHEEDDEGRAVLTLGGAREMAVVAVAHVMVLSVKAMRLYWRYFRSCLSPRSRLWERMQSGEITLLEAIAVFTIVWVTFCLLFGVYMAYVCFWNVLQNIWVDEMCYDY
ncbi:hypothetical protein VUR80DRAFT_5452 [Thermomyces stellatus]